MSAKLMKRRKRRRAFSRAKSDWLEMSCWSLHNASKSLSRTLNGHPEVAQVDAAQLKVLEDQIESLRQEKHNLVANHAEAAKKFSDETAERSL